MTDRPTKQEAIEAAYAAAYAYAEAHAAYAAAYAAARDDAYAVLAAYRAELTCIEQEYPDE